MKTRTNKIIKIKTFLSVNKRLVVCVLWTFNGDDRRSTESLFKTKTNRHQISSDSDTHTHYDTKFKVVSLRHKVAGLTHWSLLVLLLARQRPRVHQKNIMPNDLNDNMSLFWILFTVERANERMNEWNGKQKNVSETTMRICDRNHETSQNENNFFF